MLNYCLKFLAYIISNGDCIGCTMISPVFDLKTCPSYPCLKSAIGSGDLNSTYALDNVACPSILLISISIHNYGSAYSSPASPGTYLFHKVVSSDIHGSTDFQKISSGSVGGKRLMTSFVCEGSGLLGPPTRLSWAMVDMYVWKGSIMKLITMEVFIPLQLIVT
jgi:hypothetical protein